MSPGRYLFRPTRERRGWHVAIAIAACLGIGWLAAQGF